MLMVNLKEKKILRIMKEEDKKNQKYSCFCKILVLYF